MINTCFYYHLIKNQGESETVLTAVRNENGKNFQLILMEESEQVSSQIWMIKACDLEGIFYIYNCSVGLVLEVKDKLFELHHLRSKDMQKFKFKMLSAQRQQYIIQQCSKGNIVFTKDTKLVCDVKSGDDSEFKWVLKRSCKNKNILTSAIIESQFSGYVLEVADNAEKEGALLLQGGWQGMFSQRWIFEKYKDFYFIKNLKSSWVATVKVKKSKEGGEIVQEKQHESNHRFQLWSIEERGHRLYSIRLASQQQLFLGVKDHIKEKGSAVLVRQPYKNLWRIIGPAPPV